jgi:hydrogenase maturation protease
VAGVSDTLAIIGMGNTEMGDDGIGVLLVEKLRNELESGAWTPVPSRRIELSAPGMDAVLAGACLMEASTALLVDAADMKMEAGEFRVFSPEDADILGAAEAAGSAHTFPLGSVLEMLRNLGALPRVRLMGVQPAEIGRGSAVSSRLRERIPEMLDRIKEEVSLLP